MEGGKASSDGEGNGVRDELKINARVQLAVNSSSVKKSTKNVKKTTVASKNAQINNK